MRSVSPATGPFGPFSFGHWCQSLYSQVRSAPDMPLQAIDLAVAAEEIGVDGEHYRVYHFARQHGCRIRCSPRLVHGPRRSRSAPA